MYQDNLALDVDVPADVTWSQNYLNEYLRTLERQAPVDWWEEAQKKAKDLRNK